MVWYKTQRPFDGGMAGWIYNVARNPLWTVHNVPLASDPGKELYPLILSMLEIHGVQFKRR